MNNIEHLREEFFALIRDGQSRALRTKREIWTDIEKLLIEVGLNKCERLAVCNALLDQASLEINTRPSLTSVLKEENEEE